ncbi:MAG: DUF805 domain-containing protein [Azonexus sp.]|jgi:uncharacterized membrane protein YhaH (DUF805 family)|nr:DUF805 domain-containing protein [Azonexus sp.]
MSTSSNPNPFAPPRAAVADVIPGEGETFQPVKIFSATGRMGRMRYYAYLLSAYFITYVAIMALSVLLGIAGVLSAGRGDAALLGLGLGVITILFLATIPYLVLTIFWTIQRSHDMNWSGWMMLLALIPLVGLIWLFRPGTPGPNRFGPPPEPNSTGVKVIAWIGIGLTAIFILIVIAAIATGAAGG